MGRFPRQFRAIATATATEAFQQPAALLLCLACVSLTALSPVFQLFQFGEPGRLVRDGGLAFTFLSGILLAVATAGATVRREIEEGVAATVLLRPVSPGLFLSAKTAGVFGFVLVYWGCGTTATLLAERIAERFVITEQAAGYLSDRRLLGLLLAAPVAALAGAAGLNRFRNCRFSLTAFAILFFFLLGTLFLCGFFDRFGAWHLRFDPRLNVRFLPVAALVPAALLVFTALAAALATRFPAAAILIGAAAILLLGMLADILDRLAAARFGVRGLMSWIPNLQNFWTPDVLARGGSLPGAYLAGAGVYATAWTALCLLLGARVLKSRDLG